MQQAQDAAAHAAAWTAYYQSQGIDPATAYASAAQQQPAGGVGVQAGPTANPYANYGYGAGAQHSAAAYNAAPAQPHAGYAGYQPPLPPGQPHPQQHAGYQPAVAGPSQPYRPPAGPQYPQQQQQQPYGGQAAPGGYGAQGAANAYGGGSEPAGGFGPGQQRPPYGGPANGGQAGWNAGPANSPMQNQGAFRPGPQQPQGQQQQPFFGGGGGGPTTPNHSGGGGGQGGFRPSPSPGPGGQNRPYQPLPVRPVRPVATPPHGGAGAFPPAKRARFDGPGGGMGHNNNGGGGGGMGMAMGGGGGGAQAQGQGIRPPNMQNNHGVRPALPPGPAAMSGVPPRPNMGPGGGGGGPARSQAGVPGAPSGPAGGGGGGGGPRGPAGATPPVYRPPIRLGMGGPPPAMISRGGGMMGRGGAPHGGGGGRGGGRVSSVGSMGAGPGVSGAPRGPAGVSGIRSRHTPDGGRLPHAPGAHHQAARGQQQAQQSSKLGSGDDRDRREAARRKEKEKETKTTMTDFRIIGIEIGGHVGWSWGIVGEEARKYKEEADRERQQEEEETARVKQKEEEAAAKAAAAKAEAEKKKEVEVDIAVKTETQTEVQDSTAAEGAEVKAEAAENGSVSATGAASDAAAEADAKRTTKRKASMAEGEDEDEGSSKKRAALEAVEAAKAPGDQGDQAVEVKVEKADESASATAEVLAKAEPAAAVGSGRADAKDEDAAAVSAAATAQASKFEGNQNRFRIYFESPPELDRIPKAIRRGNKRWRRESSSVAPSVAPARAAQPEDPVEEEAPQPPAATDGGSAVDKAEDAVAAQPEQVEAGDGAGGEVAVTTQAESVVDPAIPAEAVAQDSSDAQAVDLAIGEPEGETATAASAPTEAIEEEQAANGADGGQDEAAEDAGDVSMVTDLGVLPDMQATQDGAPEQEEPALGGAVAESAEQAETAHEPETSDIHGAEAPIPSTADAAQSTSDVATATSAVPPVTTAEADAEILAKSAEATASAYSKARARRRSSVSSTDSQDGGAAGATGASQADESGPDGADAALKPSFNRVSVLYENSSRRLIFDAEAIKKVRIFRSEGKIEVTLQKQAAETDSNGADKLPKGVLVEMYDSADQRFVHAPLSKLAEIWSDTSEPSDEAASVPPLHREFDTAASAVDCNADEELVLTVWLNLKKPLSEPKWCRANSADEWLFDTFGSRRGLSAGGWRGKLEVVDPDPSPTVQSILESWTAISSSGTMSSRQAFIKTLLSDPNDLLEILLRLARGDRNPTLASPGTPGFGALASAIRPDSPYASHQTHVSLAVLAMYRLTTDYATKAGEGDVVREKIADIIKSLPLGMITRSLDGLYREWTDKR